MDKPFRTGQICIVIHPPEYFGDELTIASQGTEVIQPNDPGWRGVKATGLVAQHVHAHPTWGPPMPGRLFAWPIRWMVPKGVNPDPVDVVDELEVPA